MTNSKANYYPKGQNFIFKSYKSGHETQTNFFLTLEKMESVKNTIKI